MSEQVQWLEGVGPVPCACGAPSVVWWGDAPRVYECAGCYVRRCMREAKAAPENEGLRKFRESQEGHDPLFDKVRLR